MWANRYGANAKMVPATSCAGTLGVKYRISRAAAAPAVMNESSASMLCTMTGCTPSQMSGAPATPSSNIASEYASVNCAGQKMLAWKSVVGSMVSWCAIHASLQTENSASS